MATESLGRRGNFRIEKLQQDIRFLSQIEKEQRYRQGQGGGRSEIMHGDFCHADRQTAFPGICTNQATIGYYA